MKSSIYVKRQSFEVRLNSVISFVFVAFCQPRILRYSARDVTDIFAVLKIGLGFFKTSLLRLLRFSITCGL